MAKATTKKALPTSDKKGVSYRTDGWTRWQVRVRKMVKGKTYELPIEHYDVDVDAPKGSDTHIDTAKYDAERRAHVLWSQLEDQMKTWSDAPHHYTLRGVLERYLHDIDEGRISTKELNAKRKAKGLPKPTKVYLRASVHKEVSAIAVLLGTSTQGHNIGGFPNLTEKWMNQLSFKDFYDKSDTAAFNHQLKGRDGTKAPNGSVKRLLSALRTIINHANSEWGVPVNNPLKSLKGTPAAPIGHTRICAFTSYNGTWNVGGNTCIGGAISFGTIFLEEGHPMGVVDLSRGVMVTPVKGTAEFHCDTAKLDAWVALHGADPDPFLSAGISPLQDCPAGGFHSDGTAFAPGEKCQFFWDITGLISTVPISCLP